MLTAIIVDDEIKGRQSLNKLIEINCNHVRVIGMTDSADTAFDLINKHNPDLVFLDIEMPRGSGFELLKRFEKINFKIIFVTAHSHYAIKAIKFAAIDYLLKPVDVDELVEALKRIELPGVNHNDQYKGLLNNIENTKQGKISISVKDGVMYIHPSDIIRLEADGAYTYIYTILNKFTATKNIKEFEELLQNYNFFRSHNSHLINLDHVIKFCRLDGFFVEMSDGSKAEISRRKKDDFMVHMNKPKA